MGRSIAAIVIGYLVFGASAAALFQLAGVDPHAPPTAPFFVFSVAYGTIFALLAGYLTAWIAARREFWPVGVVAGFVALGAAASLAFTVGRGAIWSQLAALILMAPAVVAGGALRLRSRP